jgi:hypothetical protein
MSYLKGHLVTGTTPITPLLLHSKLPHKPTAWWSAGCWSLLLDLQDNYAIMFGMQRHIKNPHSFLLMVHILLAPHDNGYNTYPVPNCVDVHFDGHITSLLLNSQHHL